MLVWIKIRDQLGFADEVIDELFLVGVILANDFDGDALDEIAGAVLFGFVDDAHAAFENFADDFVAKLVLNCEQASHQVQDVEKSAGSSQARARGTNVKKILVNIGKKLIFVVA